MSVTETRAALVAALGSVPGLNATGYTPDVILTGSAWVAMSRAEPVNYCVQQAEWFVFVGIPNANTQAAVDYADGLIEPVISALKPLAKVVAVEPWRWPVEPGQSTVNVQRYTLEA